jgi:hypothetical protein
MATTTPLHIELRGKFVQVGQLAIKGEAVLTVSSLDYACYVSAAEPSDFAGPEEWTMEVTLEEGVYPVMARVNELGEINGECLLVDVNHMPASELEYEAIQTGK